MAQRKIYQSLHYKDLDTYVVVNGNKVLIQFRGGKLQPRVNGIFTTTDPNLIAAMDTDSGLGTSFKCIHSETFGEEKPKQKFTAADEAPLDETPETPETTGEPQDGEFKKVPGITTLQAAREYIAENFNIAKGKMPNGIAVKKAAAENKIIFTDLP